MQILVHHHGTDRYAIRGTETTVLHIDGNGYLRVVHRGKAHKDRMVLAAVLCRARLSADLHTRQDGSRHAASGATRTSVYSGTHAFHHHFIIFAVDGGITGIAIDAVQFIVFYLLHDVRSNEMPPVGNGGTQIGYLQRGGKNLSLPDGDTNHRQTVPRTPIGLVVELCIRYQSTLFAGEVGTEPIAEALRYHVVFPYGNGILRRTVFLSPNMRYNPQQK